MPSTDHRTRTASGGEPGKDVEVPASSDPRITSPLPEGLAPKRGRLARAASAAPPYTPPRDGLDFALRIWMNMEWGRTGQVVVILLALPAGLGLLAHAVVNTAVIWSMIGGILASTGTGAMTYGIARRHRRRLDHFIRYPEQPR